jgi:hypothetical protein
VQLLSRVIGGFRAVFRNSQSERVGRGFLDEEDAPDRNRVAILSYATWVDRLGARLDILHTNLTFNGLGYTGVGVVPRDFEFISKASDFQARNRFDVWVPLALNPSSAPRGTYPLRVFARLRLDNSLSAAPADLNVVAGALAVVVPRD